MDEAGTAASDTGDSDTVDNAISDEQGVECGDGQLSHTDNQCQACTRGEENGCGKTAMSLANPCLLYTTHINGNTLGDDHTHKRKTHRHARMHVPNTHTYQH
eukprot:761026-Lingulodinium_polyedra.AAC.1